MLNQASAFFCNRSLHEKKGETEKNSHNQSFVLPASHIQNLSVVLKTKQKLNSLNFIMRQLRAVRSVPVQMDFLGRNCYYLPTSVRRQSAG